MSRILVNTLTAALLALFFTGNVWATHNRAGEITYVQTGDLTIRATVTTYTKASSIAADRDSVEVRWGDGTSQWVVRSNGGGQGDLLPNDTRLNFYIATHTYPGRAQYTISMTDPNRNGGILNVNPPSSENVMFHLETTFTFLNPQFQGYNNSPRLLRPPTDIGCVGQLFVHNPTAYDIDGDSLAYELIVPFQDRNLPVPNYLFPNQINPGQNNMISLNPVSGDFRWMAPQVPGEYNIAILIKEYRQGQLINTIIRDMQILIRECDNRPPEVQTIEEICVVAGETVEFDVIATDPDRNPTQKVRLSALGGPFEFTQSRATFTVTAGFQDQPLTGKFKWVTTCDHISGRYYDVIFKADDNFFDTTGLSTLRTVRIKVSGPAPQNPGAELLESAVKLTWDSPYACEDAQNDYFRGFAIWRRNSSNVFQPDTCNPGMAGKGYTRIAFNQNNVEANKYFYEDSNIERGRTYCYRIVPEFARLSVAGNPYNQVEGLPSVEICVQLSRDIPIITKVSVEETSQTEGSIFVRWTKPLIPDLDTLLFPGPYKYVLRRGIGQVPVSFAEVPGASFEASSFSEANDTFFLDTGLNTSDLSYTYIVDFYTSGNVLYGNANQASSVFLNIVSTDKRNILSWEETVPWENYEYRISRRAPGEPDFVLLATISDSSYTDRNLTNGEEYCYFIETVGTYGFSQIEDPLFNFSQIICGIPIDTVPPCSPELTVENDCERLSEIDEIEVLFNNLSWTNPILNCEDSDDTDGYNVYYARSALSPFELIATINNAGTTTFQHNTEFGLAGCYRITALDSIGNESAPGNTVCLDNCPAYKLPNVFTPNADGSNDIFKPILNRFVNNIEFKVFNRWGNLVFESSEPLINWDGKSTGGQDLADGTYFYTCKVFEERLEGIIQSSTLLSGYIELLR